MISSQVLQVILRNIGRSDPFTRFSNEIKTMVFSHLTTSDLLSVIIHASPVLKITHRCILNLTYMTSSTCMRVSRGWHQAIKNDPSLWKNVHLGSVKYPPSRDAFQRLVLLGQHATSLSITKSISLKLDNHMLALFFKHMRKLRHLYIRWLPETYSVSSKYAAALPRELNSLTLVGIHTVEHGLLVDKLLQESCHTLEYLELWGNPPSIYRQDPLKYLNLTVLRLQGPNTVRPHLKMVCTPKTAHPCHERAQISVELLICYRIGRICRSNTKSRTALSQFLPSLLPGRT